MEIDKVEHSTARLALAHRTKVAKQRDATTFLWLYNKLIACFNCDTICHDSARRMTVEMLFRFIKRCCRYLPDEYQLAMAPVALRPCDALDVNDEEGIRCRPNWESRAPEVEKSTHVTAGDYILYFKDPKGYTVYMPNKPYHTLNLFSKFNHIRYIPPFSERLEEQDYSPIQDALKAEALLLPHNRGPCVVTGTQGTGGDDPNGTTELRWIYPPPINDYCPTHCPELTAAYKNLQGKKTFEVPQNLIMMRKDIYDLFQNHAFGIDLDSSTPGRGEIYVFHSSETVRQKIPHSSLALEVKDEMSQACLREHFHQCLMSGIIGQDVGDQFESGMANVYSMMQKLRKGLLPKAGEWPQDGGWETETGDALKEWLYYAEQENEDSD